MSWRVEEIDEAGKILFVDRQKSRLINKLKERLKEFGYQVFLVSHLPDRIDHFDYIFVLDEKAAINKLFILEATVPALIILQNKRDQLKRISSLIKKNKKKRLKVINVDKRSEDDEIIEKISWFAFSRFKEPQLDLEQEIKQPVKKRHRKLQLRLKIGKKQVFLFLFLLFFLIEILFVFPLLGAGFFLYQSVSALDSGDLSKAKNYLFYASPLLVTTRKTYSFSKPILSFFYLALLPDKILSLEEDTFSLIQEALETADNAQRIAALILETDKNSQEKKEVRDRIDKLKLETDQMLKSSSSLLQKFDFRFRKVWSLREKLIKTKEALSQVQKLLSHTGEILAETEEKNYLVLFQNNMEIRPGGGFIGSFAILTFRDFTLENIRIEDVYQADGQLEAHIEPPQPIKKYLEQPHWFLRDSNFSPDFKENFATAEFFLAKELNLSNFDGGAAITTTAVKYLLNAFGDVYLSDYDEVINSENFYIKTQTQVERDFFPGSIQKRTFLSSLVRMLLIKLESASFRKLGLALKRSLDEKQIVLYFKDEGIQQDIDLFAWNGRIIIPKCAAPGQDQAGQECLLDVVFPIDANLGVNKANFFVKRLINLKVSVKDDGEIDNFLSLTFKNDSPGEVFPSGTYKNYFQLYLPAASTVKEVLKDGTLVNDFTVKTRNQFKVVSFYFQVESKKTVKVTINYSLNKKVPKGKSVYQLIVQKQIGSANNDFVLEFYLPKSVFITSKNFSSLAKDGSLVYNTSLDSDRIFFVALTRE